MIDRLFDLLVGFVVGVIFLSFALMRHEVIETVILREGGKKPGSFSVECLPDNSNEIQCRLLQPLVGRDHQ